MRCADYIFKHLADYGLTHVFMVSGGGAMYLNDALKKEKRIKPICCHHEQACAMAAEGYSRTTGHLAVVCVTSGPGSTNAVTGLLGQFTDSIPVLYLSGQVKHETTLDSVPNSGLRQLGDQEVNIIEIVRPITKYAKMITDPQSIAHELQKAMRIAVTGRPGPVWLDIPLDVQGATLVDDMDTVVSELLKAKRPLLVAGHGIRLAEAQAPFMDLVKLLDIPVVTTFNGFDLMPTDSDNFIGRIGTLGSESGNFALQNADLVIFIGTRNNIRQVSYQWESFAKRAKKIIVDIDKAELNKPTVKGDILINADAETFIIRMLNKTPADYKSDKAWNKLCLANKKKYPIVLPEYRQESKQSVHPYHFIEELTKVMPDNAVAVADNGTACVVLFQAGIVKKGQRIFWNSGCASMGYGLPAAVGAALASNKEVICITGDGSLQMNIQELQTIKHHKLPIKIFVLNNGGYRSIEMTQDGFFDGDYIGCNKDSGVSFPDCRKIANAYGLRYLKIDYTKGLNTGIREALGANGPVLCEVILTKGYVFYPKISGKRMPDGKIVGGFE